MYQHPFLYRIVHSKTKRGPNKCHDLEHLTAEESGQTIQTVAAETTNSISSALVFSPIFLINSTKQVSNSIYVLQATKIF